MSIPSDKPRLMIIGAHPDDAEYHAGGLATIYRNLGRCVRMLSVTNGGAGHFFRNSEELVEMRCQEAAAAGEVIGASYETLGFPDGELLPTIEVRQRIIREIREFNPDLVLTHRVCDYHPDHRATGQVVQDASYLVTVPLVLPEVAPLFRAPVFAYMTDLFTRPTRLRADVIIDVESHIDTIVAMLACQQSQVFEWLPYEDGILESLPDDFTERLKWLKKWYAKHALAQVEHFREEINAVFGEYEGQAIRFAEVFEISEYGSQPDSERIAKLFPSSEIQSSGLDWSIDHRATNGVLTNHRQQVISEKG